MSSILDEIIYHKRAEVSQAQKNLPLDTIKASSAAFTTTPWLEAFRSGGLPKVIAEIKRASPSRGIFAPNLDPIATAIDYLNSGATAISVLTEKKYFHGNPEFIQNIKLAFRKHNLSPIPLLRKDFIIEPYQVWESRAIGADALLLLINSLSPQQLKELINESISAGLGILAETHSVEEVKTLLEVCSDIPNSKNFLALGINNRDLNTFKVDLSITEMVLSTLQEEIVSVLGNNVVIVSESGISSKSEIARLTSAGATAFLIGEHFVINCDTANNSPGKRLQQLIK